MPDDGTATLYARTWYFIALHLSAYRICVQRIREIILRFWQIFQVRTYVCSLCVRITLIARIIFFGSYGPDRPPKMQVISFPNYHFHTLPSRSLVVRCTAFSCS